MVAAGRRIVEVALRLVNPAINCESRTLKNALAAIAQNKKATPTEREVYTTNSENNQIANTERRMSKTLRDSPRTLCSSATRPKPIGTHMLESKYAYRSNESESKTVSTILG